MHSRYSRGFGAALIAVALLAPAARAQKAPALPDVLHAAGDYLVQYSQLLMAIAAEEEFTQQELSTGKLRDTRRLNSDFVLVGLGDGALAGFRDVFAKDNNRLRDRQERLLALFTNGSSTSLARARQISEECVRDYLSGNLAVLDEPTLALEFLRQQNQARSTFKLESVKTMDGAQIAIVRFSEQQSPRLVSVPGAPGATGRFWVDVASGTIRQTELILSTGSSNLRAAVNYALEPKLGLWLPLETLQQSDISVSGTGNTTNVGPGGGFSVKQSLEARAKYSKFRQVTIDLSKIVR